MAAYDDDETRQFSTSGEPDADASSLVTDKMDTVDSRLGGEDVPSIDKEPEPQLLDEDNDDTNSGDNLGEGGLVDGDDGLSSNDDVESDFFDSADADNDHVLGDRDDEGNPESIDGDDEDGESSGDYDPFDGEEDGDDDKNDDEDDDENSQPQSVLDFLATTKGKVIAIGSLCAFAIIGFIALGGINGGDKDSDGAQASANIVPPSSYSPDDIASGRTNSSDDASDEARPSLARPTRTSTTTTPNDARDIDRPTREPEDTDTDEPEPPVPAPEPQTQAPTPAPVPAPAVTQPAAPAPTQTPVQRPRQQPAGAVPRPAYPRQTTKPPQTTQPPASAPAPAPAPTQSQTKPVPSKKDDAQQKKPQKPHVETVYQTPDRH